MPEVTPTAGGMYPQSPLTLVELAATPTIMYKMDPLCIVELANGTPEAGGTSASGGGSLSPREQALEARQVGRGRPGCCWEREWSPRRAKTCVEPSPLPALDRHAVALSPCLADRQARIFGACPLATQLAVIAQLEALVAKAEGEIVKRGGKVAAPAGDAAGGVSPFAVRLPAHARPVCFTAHPVLVHRPVVQTVCSG